ncbi:MAG: PIN domain-containing protein [Verrucomicrobia bacterium]|nr:PIN domain-containing protein [Verrucomicrobiota bacterium]
MIADFPVVLDACVLANFGVCDLFLRLAEPPRLYAPRWSDEILAEVRRTHLRRLNPPWPEKLADSWQREVARAFPDAKIMGYEHLLAALTNDEEDRHVLAAAIKGSISVIVTFNLRHFPSAALKLWHVEALHPQDYLLTLYSMNPPVVFAKLVAISHDNGSELEDTLIHLGKSVPRFAKQILDDMGENGGPLREVRKRL